jgi:hypothetical protein
MDNIINVQPGILYWHTGMRESGYIVLALYRCYSDPLMWWVKFPDGTVQLTDVWFLLPIEDDVGAEA